MGTDAEYFVGEVELNDQRDDPSIINYNPPSEQPTNCCGWTLTSDYSGLTSKGIANRHDEYINWLSYLIKNFFVRWGYILNGRVIIKSDNPQLLIVNNNNIVTFDLYQFMLKELTEKDICIKKLELRVEMLENEIQFNPDGKGAQDAKTDFYSLASTC